jgi:YegS/Rv2252/BmrU family lipid kinase
MKPFVVHNPSAGGGRTGRLWPEIAARLERAIGPFEAAATGRPGEATTLVASALAAGPRLVVAIGGDGTVSEAIDGLAGSGRGAPFGFVSTGTGRDFRRSFGWSGDWRDDIDRLASDGRRQVDLGRLEFTRSDGAAAQRHFNNVSSFGLSGEIVAAVNGARLSRCLGPKQLFKFKSVTSLLTYRYRRVRIEIDNSVDETLDMAVVAIANGRYFGGGMMVAPMAAIDDGLLEVVVVRGHGKLGLIRSFNLLYAGAHLSHPAISLFRGRRIRATPADAGDPRPILIDADGEQPGRLPATFEILPGALTLCS